MKITPSKVKFNKEDFNNLQNDVEKLEKELDEAHLKLEEISRFTETWWTKLSKVIDLSEINVQEVTQMGIREFSVVRDYTSDAKPKLYMR